MMKFVGELYYLSHDGSRKLNDEIDKVEKVKQLIRHFLIIFLGFFLFE